jgi:DNA mismatch repair protein MutL
MGNNTTAKKRWIRPLPERLINKIAAGEVIERPAAVLKELVENALDAGATAIDIDIEKSGTKRILITDNGCGIEPDQIEIAFSRHATSKISDFDDLERLISFGFRGEALPSIASVSRTRLVSKTHDAENGMEIIIEGGVVQSLKPVAASVGTTVEVENLFFNTPARRKFLKSEATEASYLNRNAIAMALSSSGVAFKYRINGRRLFELSAADNDPKARVARILLQNNIEQLMSVFGDTSDVKIEAYLSYPLYCRTGQTGLYLFINHRFIKSPGLAHGVVSGYRELLQKGQYPVGAVFMHVDPAQVDVNVHPTKAEVRLSQESKIHDLLHEAVKRTLRATGVLPTPNVLGSPPASPQKTTPQYNDYRAQPAAARDIDITLLKKLYRGENEMDSTPDSFNAGHDSHKTPIIVGPAVDNITAPPEEPEFERFQYLGQFGTLYLLFSDRDVLFIVDQHAAHERVLYEQTLAAIERGCGVSQSLLFPVHIELSADRFALYEMTATVLQSSGFDAEPFGATTVLLSAVPAALSKKSPEKAFDEIIADIEQADRAGSDIKNNIAQSIACRGAVMHGDKMTETEARALIRRLYRCHNHHTCPHGRPIVLRLTRDELDAKFGR